MVRSRSRGFTLVELLVVITIIGMLMALLLPAVNAAVEAARSITCKNNIANLAKANNTFENSKKRFPGYVNKVGTHTDAPWIVAIFPQVERQDLYDAWSNGTKTGVYHELLVCPSNPPEQIGTAKNSYIGNSGFQGQAYGTAAEKTQAVANGIMHDLTTVSTADTLADGASNTLLLSENIGATTWNLTTNQRIPTTFVWFDTATPSTDQKINGNKLVAATTLNLARPSSFHSGGVNVAFCDTHVIFLREDVDYKVYTQLMTPNSNDSSANATVKAYILNGANYQ